MNLGMIAADYYPSNGKKLIKRQVYLNLALRENLWRRCSIAGSNLLGQDENPACGGEAPGAKTQTQNL